ncbi:TIGR03767 family metallophosphoesterase [Streptomyces marispadix]|uniref:TIGR03767 family metallophosphoesterase n=1 Tax=Streptomyces marispadix TaxID=2922868 RepID=A0ABS9SVK4_9ACTN|nr:TIGR03767 family metallophosphoesterase [Streptomyces marispadix]MCH6160305.1 TIGR03767 family metallophosphoesterase [Streptomyces marispadix]
MDRSSRWQTRLPDRRTLLTLGAAGAATVLGAAPVFNGGSANAGQPSKSSPSPGASASARARAARARAQAPVTRAEPVEPSPEGTTLARVSTPRGGSGGYRRLGDGPGWKRLVRTDLAEARQGRTEKRRLLTAFVQFTDLHMVDVQHPLRYEYLRTETTSAWRPQEALSVAGAVSLIERVNGLRGGPATGEPLSFVVTTGDNTDNNCRAELDWFLTAMTGGRITPNTGDVDAYEGVQSSGLRLYWQPEDELRDDDKALGFPRIDGYLRAAIREVNSPGLALPWYSTSGNHDALPGGCYAGDSFFADFAVGGRKLMELESEAEAARLWKTVEDGGDPKGEQLKEALRERLRSRTMRRVTADLQRAPFTRRDWVRAHMRKKYEGAGPVGHGYTEANLAEDRLYYTFRISEDVTGVSLDTTRHDGGYPGSVGDAQLAWLERRLKEERAKGTYVLLFSHHTSTTIPDGGDRLLSLLHANPHVVAWINGHSHKNRIRPRRTFWEISTASHIDFPQLARTLELADNGDGTLSLFATLIESSAPARTDFHDLSQTGLASLYRELALNSPGARQELSGEPDDRNVELLLRKP